ncbi:MAG: DUF72 domain-containing protein [Pyrinomonadaceae bacterium]
MQSEYVPEGQGRAVQVARDPVAFRGDTLQCATVMGGKVFIGTSGWHYKHWLGLFYPEKFRPNQMLEFYAHHFNTVELNNSFYHLPRLTAFDNWHDSTPRGFVFAVKGSRFITHMKKLKDPESSTDKFFLGAERLQEKLGPILFQLPPHWKLNLQRLDEFLRSLPNGHRYAFEFRDASWLVNDLYELLRQHNAAFCIHDLAGQQTPLEVTADFTYVRFHGPGEAKYAGSYSTEALRVWAKRVKEWKNHSGGIYMYFNNDIGGHAPKNALELKELIREFTRL